MVEIAVTGTYFYTTPVQDPKLGRPRGRSQRQGLSGVSFTAMGLTPWDFFVKARFEPAAAAVLLVSAGWYIWSVRRVRRRGLPWPAARMASFAAAWVLVAVAVFSGLSAFATTNFSAFGSQYIMVGLVGPVLLAFSAPLTLAIQSSARPRRALSVDGPLLKAVGNPFTTWAVFVASVFLVYFTGVAGDAIGGGLVQQAVFLWLLAAGWLFYWPVIAVDPLPFPVGYWPRVLYLLLSFPVFAIMGMGLESQTGRVAPGVSLASLHLGGAVVWVAGEGLALCGALWVFAQWLRTDERRARSRDRANEEAAARQLALWRASRDAAARAASR